MTLGRYEAHTYTIETYEAIYEVIATHLMVEENNLMFFMAGHDSPVVTFAAHSWRRFHLKGALKCIEKVKVEKIPEC